MHDLLLFFSGLARKPTARQREKEKLMCAVRAMIITIPICKIDDHLLALWLNVLCYNLFACESISKVQLDCKATH